MFLPFMGGGRGAGGAAPAPSGHEVRVVADTATNSLLVRASPLDMLSIRSLLARALDTDEVDSKALARTWRSAPAMVFFSASRFANASR